MPQPQPSIADATERASSDLDTLIQELRLGIRDRRHYDQLEERARAIADALVMAFRGSPARPAGDGVVRTSRGVWAR